MNKGEKTRKNDEQDWKNNQTWWKRVKITMKHDEKEGKKQWKMMKTR